MITVPNFLSLLRVPLALVFLQSNPIWRALAIVAAMITDGLDGFLARRYDMKSKVGVFLDPVMDKFFVIFIAVTFINEGSLGIYEALALICRDFSVVIFGIYLSFAGKLTSYRFRSIWCGKATTFLQFFALLGLTFGFAIPSIFYTIFIILGLLALAELYIPLTSRNI